ncbi:MAG TPA: PQQ-dependent sugar dehydrogenase [Bdellovibrionales bacterium]|nr:PQQ-dependent sugar dehydrogenase [Bdellovibrionales bacterium]
MKTLIALLLPVLAQADIQLDKLKMPAHLKLTVFADKVKNARSMTSGPDGLVFVGTRGEGSVYALLPDKNGDGKSDGTVTIAKDLNSPNGVAFKNGDLYVAEIDRVLLFKDIAKTYTTKPKPVAWGPSFPSDKHHGWKFIAFGPDGWLYVPVGAPCNLCLENPDLYAAIHRVSPDGKKRELVARGVRNTVGFDWQPGSGDFWFTDNGRDWMGDDKPPCEMNRLSKLGEHFGYPHCHGADLLDPEYGKGKQCSSYTPMLHGFTPHSAPLGMRFIKNEKIAGKGAILIAEHGSWNRSTPVGYQITRLKVDGARVASADNFITGFLQGRKAWGRPVDLLELPDGSVLISDDYADAIYRLTAK